MRILLLILFALVSFPAFSSSYTKVANNGTDLPDSAVLGSGATDWACTRDDTSGLIWEVKTADGGLRDASNTYTNYDDLTQAQKFNGSAWINPTQAEIDAASNSIGFVKTVNSQALCGHVDWKMPNKDELLSLMDPVYNPRINPTYFQVMPVTNYWSSTPYSSATFGATYMSFSNFYVGYSDRNQIYQVRLVSAAQSRGTFSLAVRAGGAGSGSITKIYGGITCESVAGSVSGTCLINILSANEVTLVATPLTGFTFGGWSGACTSVSATTCTVILDASKSVIASFTKTQTITLGAAPALLVGGTGALSATASSGLPVSFSSLTPSVCIVEDLSVTGVAAGSCTIAANQAGDGDYSAAPQVTQNINVSLASQTISYILVDPTTVSVGGTGSISAAASSGLPVMLTSTTTGICSVSDGIVYGLAVGNCIIAANAGGDSTYSPAPQVTLSITVTAALIPPSAPTILSIMPGNASATISFAPSTSDVGLVISSFTASCTASGQTPSQVSGSASPIAVTNLTNGVVYDCSVIATNEAGASDPSASRTVIPESYTQTVEKLYVAYFGRPGDPLGVNYWVAELAASNGSSATLQNMFTSFYASAEYTALHVGQTTGQLINSLYQYLFSRDVEQAGLDYWTQQITSGVDTLDKLSYILVTAATDKPGGNQDLTVLNNKATVATTFTTHIDEPAELARYKGTAAYDIARTFIATVNTSVPSDAEVDAAILSLP